MNILYQFKNYITRTDDQMILLTRERYYEYEYNLEKKSIKINHLWKNINPYELNKYIIKSKLSFINMNVWKCETVVYLYTVKKRKRSL